MTVPLAALASAEARAEQSRAPARPGALGLTQNEAMLNRLRDVLRKNHLQPLRLRVW